MKAKSPKVALEAKTPIGNSRSTYASILISAVIFCILKLRFMATAHNRKKTTIRVAFGQEVRSRRHKMGLTIEQLAEAADLHHNYVGSVERGERNIALENIIALARALKCSAKDLIP